MISNKIKQFDLLSLRFAFVGLITLLAIYWEQFLLNSRLFSHLSVLWIICVYRCSRKQNSNIQSELFLAFWIRLGWFTCYHFHNTGKLYANQNEFITIVVQCFVIAAISAAMPYHWIQRIWTTKFTRWLILVIDQGTNNGLNFHGLFKSEFLIKDHSSLLIPIFIIITRSITRPGSQIVVAFLGGYLKKDNLVRWIKIGLLNCGRFFTLTFINYLSYYYLEKGYFNTIFFAMGGYMMYMQSYLL